MRLLTVELAGHRLIWPGDAALTSADLTGFARRYLSWPQDLPDVVPVRVTVALREASGWAGDGPDRT